MQVTDLIRYNHVVRGLYLDAFAKLPWIEVIADKGLSFGSMRNVFLHLTIVEDRWMGYIIPMRFKEWVDLDFDAFWGYECIEEIYAMCEGKHRGILGRAFNRRTGSANHCSMG